MRLRYGLMRSYDEDQQSPETKCFAKSSLGGRGEADLVSGAHLLFILCLDFHPASQRPTHTFAQKTAKNTQILASEERTNGITVEVVQFGIMRL